MTGRMRFGLLLLLLVLPLAVGGCSQPKAESPVVDQVNPDLLLPSSERWSVPEFSGEDLFGDQAVEFPLPTDQGKVYILTFFSPG